MKLSSKSTTYLIGAILFINYSMMFLELFSATVRVILSILIVALIYVLGKKKVKLGEVKRNFSVNKRVFKVAITLVGIITVSCAINGFDTTFDLYTIIIILLSAFLASTIEKDSFRNAYINSMCCLGLVSSVLFILYRLIPSIFAVFPTHIWQGDIAMKNLLFCVVQTNSQYIRNFGIFYEPGMFSCFLVFSIYLLLFHSVVDIRKLIILSIALLTTLSTNGYICLTILVLTFVFTNSNISKKIKKRLVAILSVIFVGAVIFLVNNRDAYLFLIRKFSEISFSNVLSMDRMGSGYERWRSVILAWEAIKTNPIFGVATVGWQKLFVGVIGTATPLNWFALYGFLYGIMMNGLYLKTAVVHTSRNRYVKTVIGIIVLLLNIMTQNMHNNIIVIILIFQSLMKNKKKMKMGY